MLCVVLFCNVNIADNLNTTTCHFSLFNIICKTTLPELSTYIYTPFHSLLKTAKH